MAPKKRAPSPGPKAKAKGKAGSAQPKAAPEPEVDTAALLKAEGKDMFEKYRDDDAGVKLKGFAQCIRAMNVKKVHIWDDNDIGPQIIKKQWDAIADKAAKEVIEAVFVEWWPTFVKMVEDRQAEIKAAEDKVEEEKKAKAEAKANLYDAVSTTGKDNVWTIPLKDLDEACKEAYKRDKTPLIIDNTEGFRSEAFFLYTNAYILECKKLILDKVERSKKLTEEADKAKVVPELLAETRDSFCRAHCFKYGQTVVFRLANSACDFKGTFNGEAFPALSLFNAAEVKKVLGQDNAGNWKGSPFEKMCDKQEDKEEPSYTGVNEKFRVVVVTQFQEDAYAEYLEKMIPLELMQPIKPFVD